MRSRTSATRRLLRRFRSTTTPRPRAITPMRSRPASLGAKTSWWSRSRSARSPARSSRERVPVAAAGPPRPDDPEAGETAGEWWDNTGHAEAIAELLRGTGRCATGAPRPSTRCSSMTSTPRSRERTSASAAHPARACSPSHGRSRPGRTCPLECWRRARTGSSRSAFQRRVARERLDLEVDVMPGGHLPMLARPRELAEHLVRLARA